MARIRYDDAAAAAFQPPGICRATGSAPGERRWRATWPPGRGCGYWTCVPAPACGQPPWQPGYGIEVIAVEPSAAMRAWSSHPGIPARLDNSGLVGWLARQLKGRLRVGVVVSCGTTASTAESMASGLPMELLPSVLVEFSQLRRQSAARTRRLPAAPVVESDHEVGMGTEVTFVELPAGLSWWRDGRLTTLTALRPGLDAESLHRVLLEGAAEGLRYHGAVVGGRCLGVAGWRMITTTVFGRSAYLDDLVVDAQSRSAGIGRTLLVHVAEEAARPGANALTLDSAVHRIDVHRFHFRERLHIAAFHFTRQLST